MKRLDLVQLILIIVGIFSIFFFINYIPRFLIYLVSWFYDGVKGGYLLDALIEIILTLSMYLLIAIYAIKNSGHFAKWICSKSGLNTDINFSLNKTELLFALFTGLGIYGLIKNFPELIINIYNRIKDSNSFLPAEGVYKYSNSELAIQVVTVLLFFTLVYYSKIFAGFFAARINNAEPEDEITDK